MFQMLLSISNAIFTQFTQRCSLSCLLSSSTLFSSNSHIPIFYARNHNPCPGGPSFSLYGAVSRAFKLSRPRCLHLENEEFNNYKHHRVIVRSVNIKLVTFSSSSSLSSLLMLLSAYYTRHCSEGLMCNSSFILSLPPCEGGD